MDQRFKNSVNTLHWKKTIRLIIIFSFLTAVRLPCPVCRRREGSFTWPKTCLAIVPQQMGVDWSRSTVGWWTSWRSPPSPSNASFTSSRGYPSAQSSRPDSLRLFFTSRGWASPAWMWVPIFTHHQYTTLQLKNTTTLSCSLFNVLTMLTALTAIKTSSRLEPSKIRDVRTTKFTEIFDS